MKPTNWRFAALALLFVVLPLASCTEPPPPTPTPDSFARPERELAKKQLAAARERWEANRSDSYSFHIRYTCHWCGYHDQPLEVTVRNGVIHSVVHVDSGTWFDPDDEWQRDAFKTIDVLFNRLETAMDSWSVYGVNVLYHAELGYPLNIGYADYAGYEGLSVRLANYQGIPSHATFAPTPTPEPSRDEAMAELAAAKALWNANGSLHYDIEYTVGIRERFIDSRLPPEFIDLTFRLTIRDGRLESATWLGGADIRVGEPLPLDDDDWRFVTQELLAVDDLFDAIEEWLSEALDHPYPWQRDAALSKRPEYDPDFGYPREVGLKMSTVPPNTYSG